MKVNKFYEDLDLLELRFPVSDIAKETGFAASNISDYINKKKTPSQKFIDKFYEVFNKKIQAARDMEGVFIVREPNAEYKTNNPCDDYLKIIEQQNKTISEQQALINKLITGSASKSKAS
jgi:predicted transcriptional regulator